uniref:glycine-rich protein n=1 Tax=Brucella endophytica TaxID=1963359 RepID=UPI0035BC22F0
MENRHFSAHWKSPSNFIPLRSASKLLLLTLPACFLASPFARADVLPPQCHHPYNEPNRVTCVYTFTGREQTFAVPDGVTLLDVTAIGAAGAAGEAGDPSRSGTGGKGGRADALIAVTPNSTLYVEVGGIPTADIARCFNPPLLCVGGWNGGGSTGFQNITVGLGGGGGGASDVRTISMSVPGSLNSRLIVAAGGGGGGSGCGNGKAACNGGNGGDAGSQGQNGQPLPSQSGGTGGGAGTQSAGGTGGTQGGGAGSLGLGGNGGTTPAPSFYLPVAMGGGAGGGAG